MTTWVIIKSGFVPQPGECHTRIHTVDLDLQHVMTICQLEMVLQHCPKLTEKEILLSISVAPAMRQMSKKQMKTRKLSKL